MPKKILIVEDDPALLDLLSFKVKKLNYIVVVAKNGKQALQKFKKELPDLVLLDIVIPLKSGVEVLEEIRTKHKSKVPVIILSNLADTQDMETVAKLGAVGYIVKSDLTIEEVMDKIKKAIGG